VRVPSKRRIVSRERIHADGSYCIASIAYVVTGNATGTHREGDVALAAGGGFSRQTWVC
jgi:hypothetical protein